MYEAENRWRYSVTEVQCDVLHQAGTERGAVGYAPLLRGTTILHSAALSATQMLYQKNAALLDLPKCKQAVETSECLMELTCCR